MTQHPNINLKVELCRNPITETLDFIIHFNPQSFNLTIENQNIQWIPTKDEQRFLIEVFSLLENKQTQLSKEYHSGKDQPENEMPPHPPMENTINQAIEKHIAPDTSQSNTQEKIEEIINKKRTTF